MKSKFSLTGLVLCVFIGLLFSYVFSISPIAGICLIVSLSFAVSFYKSKGFVFFDGLSPEVWTGDIREEFFPNTSFMSEPTDFSPFVEYDAINMVEAGADPSVLKNNTVYPVGTADGADTPIRKVLDYYDTTTTVLRNAVAVEVAHDMRKLYTNKHKRTLLQKISNDGAHAYAPAATGGLNTVVDATADVANKIIERIIDMQTFYNNGDAPEEGRIAVLHPSHLAVIAKEDMALYKAFNATPGSLFYSFKIYTYSGTPFYIKSTGVKAAQGVAFNSGIHARGSFFFTKSEVMKAMGTLKMFDEMNSPSLKGDAFNFQQRAYVDKIRNRFAGAIFK